MKKFISLAFIAIMMFAMSACGSSNNSGDDALEGMYLVSNVEMYGEELNYADLVYLEMAEGTYLEFYGDGYADLALAGEETLELIVDLDAKTLTDPSDVSLNFELDGDSIILTGYDFDSIVFTLEDSSEWDAIMAVPSELEEMMDDFVEDDSMLSDEEFVSPTIAFSAPSYWYGYMNISFYEGSGEHSSGDYDVWAIINTDDSGNTYFEIFDVFDMNTDPIASYYIDLDDTSFEPVINDEAWIYENIIAEENSFDFSAYLINGSFYISHEYVDDDESFYVSFTFREEGTPWDVDMEILPPGYDSYGPGY